MADDAWITARVDANSDISAGTALYTWVHTMVQHQFNVAGYDAETDLGTVNMDAMIAHLVDFDEASGNTIANEWQYDLDGIP